LRKPEVVEQTVAQELQFAVTLAIEQDRIRPLCRSGFVRILARQNLMIGLDAGLPLFDARYGKTLHETRPAKFPVDHHGQMMRFLLGDHIADRLVLRLAQLLSIDFSKAELCERLFQSLRPEQAADLVDSQRF
jgi:hypothetical protein